MSHWNHRVFKETYKENVPDNPIVSEDTEWFAIREVYYNDDGSIVAYGNPTTVEGDTVDDLRQLLTWMLGALDTPILSEDTVVLVDDFDEEDDEEEE